MTGWEWEHRATHAYDQENDHSARGQVPPSPLELLGGWPSRKLFSASSLPLHKSGAATKIKGLFPCRPKLINRLRLPLHVKAPAGLLPVRSASCVLQQKELAGDPCMRPRTAACSARARRLASPGGREAAPGSPGAASRAARPAASAVVLAAAMRCGSSH
jgi:hypothetical protein